MITNSVMEHKILELISIIVSIGTLIESKKEVNRYDIGTSPIEAKVTRLMTFPRYSLAV